MPCSDSCRKLEDDHAENHYEDNRKHKLKHHKHIAHLFFIFRPRITLSTKHTTITKSEAAIYSNVSVYHGEEYDAALELPGWADAAAPNAAPAGRWHGVETVTYPAAQLYAQAAGKVSVRNRLPAQRIFTTPAGETVVDFGQNMAGRVEITATGGPGDVAELRCFEELDADGNAYLANLRKARTIMRYKFAQPGTVTWHPQFTYMGFRYALVVQWPGTPRAENFTAYTLHTAMEPAGQFQCSEHW